MEHYIRCVFRHSILVLDSKLQTIRTSNSGTGHIQLPMSEDLRSEPQSHILQCLTCNIIMCITYLCFILTYLVTC